MTVSGDLSLAGDIGGGDEIDVGWKDCRDVPTTADRNEIASEPNKDKKVQ